MSNTNNNANNAKKANKNINNPPYGVIFDMDGVLVDSMSAIVKSFNKLFKPYGDFTEKDMKTMNGKSLQDQIPILNRKYGSNYSIEDFNEELWLYELSEIRKNPLKENIRQLLEDLRNNRIPMAVGTSSQKYRAHQMLEEMKIKEYFTAIITSECVEYHKPNPEVFLKAAEGIKMPPERCVVIEDSTAGILAAKTGNFKSIGIASDYHAIDEFTNADIALRNIEHLTYKVINNLFNQNK
ncbi:MAG: HAD family hydrolase [Candidatus Woesearchaeota archaeon]